MQDTTSYADKLPPSLNQVLKTFTNSECVMVRKIKAKDSIYSKVRNCHLNVKSYIEKFGGSSVSGWLLLRNTMQSDRGMYAWSFHSVWQKPDGKWLDVTEDKNYLGRDKSIFIPDSQRLLDFAQGLSYNNFMVFTEPKFAAYYGNSIGVQLLTDKVYWSDTVMMRVMDTEQHSGIYRLLTPDYPNNLKMLCDEYELEIVNGKPKAKPGSRLDGASGFPLKMIFDYSISTRGESKANVISN